MFLLLPILFSALFFVVGCAGTNRPVFVATGPIQAEVEALLEREGYGPAQLGVQIVDLETRQVICELNPDRAFLPASNQKLFTAALALSRLGPAWQARTELYLRGKVAGGVLEGDLVIRGGGDPTFGRGEKPLAVFRGWAEQLYESGIRVVTGDVVGDDNLFADDGLGEGWAWDDCIHPYSAPFGAWVFHENLVDLILTPGEPGRVATLKQVPLGIEVENSCLAVGGGKEDVIISRELSPLRLSVRGTIPAAGGKVTCSVPVFNPTLYAARAMQRALEMAGIQVQGAAADIDDKPGFLYEPTAANRRAQYLSPPLVTQLAEMLGRSQNLFAENHFRLAGMPKSAADGAASAASARTEMDELFARLGVRKVGYFARDGSGLSRYNLVTPRQVVTLLAAAWEQEWGKDLFACLPLAGRSGTLKTRFLNTSGEDLIRAKTGTLTRVSALSGFIPRSGRKPLVFSWLLSGFCAPLEEVRGDMDRVLSKVVELCAK